MKKYFKHDNKTYEGIFIPLPGKQNYGHLMVDGVLLYGLSPDNTQGEPVIFNCGRADEVVVYDIEAPFTGFFNLNTGAEIKGDIKPKEPKPTKPIKLNEREKIIVSLSKDAEEIMIALRKAASDGIVFVKDVKDVNPNKLYGHLINLENAKLIQRLGKDKKRGTKIQIL